MGNQHAVIIQIIIFQRTTTMQRRNTKTDNATNPTPYEGRADEEESILQSEGKNKGKTYSTKDKSQSPSFSKRSTCLACVLLITIKKCIKLSILFIGVTIAGKFMKTNDDKISTNVQNATTITQPKLPPSFKVDNNKHIPSHNVDGQKKLRYKMLELRDRQLKGLDLNVKIRTRWVGDKAQYWGNDLDLDKDVTEEETIEEPAPVIMEPIPNQEEVHLGNNALRKPMDKGVSEPPVPMLEGEEIKLYPKSGSHTSTNNAIFGFAQ